MLKRCCNKFFYLFIMSVLLGGCKAELTGILNPKGLITFQERQILFDVLALMLIVVIPVVIMSFAFVHRYHIAHRTSEYKPNWCHNVFLEALWWGVPCAIIVIMGIMTWRMTHKLDPFRRIDVPGKIMPVEAIALPWKWLFIYPQQHIATVNELVIPKDKQVQFFLTSDNVPMSAFFIPQLGSQIYTMAGMRTQLHLIGNHKGIFEGLNAQYNGDGFSDMHFKVKVVSQDKLQQWFAQVKQSPKTLNQQSYNQLRQPSIAAPVEYFSKDMPGLFEGVIHSYKELKRP